MTSQARIDCVVWDVGNVLIRWDAHNLYRQRGMQPSEIAAFLAETELLQHNIELDRGGSFAEVTTALAARFPHHREHLLAFDHDWPLALDGAIDSSVAVLGQLRAAGVPCHAISNFNREKFDTARGLFPFLDTFDELIVSADVQLLKPDPTIFQVLLDRRGLNAARALFIDDSAANIAAAHRLGFQTHHFNEATSNLAAELRHYGLY